MISSPRGIPKRCYFCTLVCGSTSINKNKRETLPNIINTFLVFPFSTYSSSLRVLRDRPAQEMNKDCKNAIVVGIIAENLMVVFFCLILCWTEDRVLLGFYLTISAFQVQVVIFLLLMAHSFLLQSYSHVPSIQYICFII